MRRHISLLAAIGTLAATLVVVNASPAAASVVTYACNPSGSTWARKAAWSDGTVMEARACLQYDTDTPYGPYTFHRVRVEWRMRRGTTALSGTDWDLSPDYWTQLTVEGTLGPVGEKEDFADIFNKSYIVTYSAWVCAGSAYRNIYYLGEGIWIRATPPGLPKSSLHSYTTRWTNWPNLSCD